MPILDTPDIKTKAVVAPEILAEVEEEGQVIVHCNFNNDQSDFIGAVGIRVWESTFLIDQETQQKSKLIKAIHIPYAPDWYFVYPMENKKFTLIFEKLPKACTAFTFVELIPEPGAFIVENIPRNDQDVYRVTLS